MKVVINRCYGGFGLSAEAEKLLKKGGWPTERIDYLPFPDSGAPLRADPLLVRIVESLGTARASDNFSELVVIDIPDGIQWGIAEFDGLEHIYEHHRTWP